MGNSFFKINKGLGLIEQDEHTYSSPDPGDIFYSSESEQIKAYSQNTWLTLGHKDRDGGAINYIRYSDAEDNTVADWDDYDDGPVAIPIDGTGSSSSNTTFTSVSNTNLRGFRTFKLHKDLADAQGEGWSNSFTIKNPDKSSTLDLSFDYYTSGGYLDGDVVVYLYDITNTTLITPSKTSISTHILSGRTGTFKTTFQTTTSSSYRVIFHVATDSTSSTFDLFIDNLAISPQVQSANTSNDVNYIKNGNAEEANTNGWVQYYEYLNPNSSSGLVTEGTDTINVTGHGLRNGMTVLYFSNNTVIGGLSQYGDYYVVNATTNTFQLSATDGGSAVNLTSDGAGTQFFMPDQPITGEGGSPTSSVTLTAQDTEVLRGNYSFKLAKDANRRRSFGYSYDFTIDSVDQNTPQQVEIEYDTTGTNLSGLSGAGLVVYLYDKDNAKIITPANTTIVNGRKGKLQTSFNATDSSNYRFILHIADSSSIAWDFYFDSVRVGPIEYMTATPTSDWTSYTSNPSVNNGFGTLASENLEYRRTGDTMDIRGYFTTGSVSANEGRLALPDGLTVGGTGTGSVSVGRAWRDVSSTLSALALVTKGDNYLNFSVFTSGSSSTPGTPSNGNAWISAAQRAMIEVQGIPITEWAGSANYANSQVEFASNSNTSTSPNTTDFAYGSEGSSFPVSLSARTQKRINFPTAIQPTDKITFEVDMYGDGNWTELPAMAAGGNDIAAGDRNSNVGVVLEHVGGNNNVIDVEFQKYRYGGSTVWGSLLATAKWRVRKSASPSPVMYPPAIVATYNQGSSQTLSNATWTTIDYDTKEYDSNNAVTTGSSWVFTVPRTGLYNVSGLLGLNSIALATTEYLMCRIHDGSNILGYSNRFFGNGASVNPTCQINKTLYLVAGDSIYIEGYQNSGGNIGTLTGSNNYINISEIK